MVRMSIAGLGYASWDQMWTSPKEWGTGWHAYGKRVASNIGATAVQETVTEGLAAVMDRPLSYMRCKCNGTGQRVGWAVRGAFFDQVPHGRLPIAVPRIVGGYVGAYTLTTWMPPRGHSRAAQTLIDGTVTLGMSALINLTYEFILK